MTDYHGPEYVRAQAKTAADARLKEAARHLANQPTKVSEIEFSFGPTRYRAWRTGAPEVVTVIEKSTSFIWAVSAPGMPEQLCPNFKPYTPALEQSVIVDR